MIAIRLILKSLLYYWKTNLAVLLGVVAGSTVIGGALIVGDSVRESLSQISLKRLGKVDFALSSPRFFREELAEEIAASPEFTNDYSSVAPGLSLSAALQFTSNETKETRRANQVGLWGLDQRLWSMIGPDDLPAPVGREIILSQQTAEALQVKSGDNISLFVELPATIPRGSILGERKETSQELTFNVSHILSGQSSADRFQLNPSQKLTLNAFVSLEELQVYLDLAAIRRSPKYPEGMPAKINSLFVAAKRTNSHQLESATTSNNILNQQVKDSLTLDDLQLKLRTIEDHSYVTLESHQMILDATTESAASKAANSLDCQASPVLVYLANELGNNSSPENYSMYSVIAGLDRATLNSPPFGPPPMRSGEWPVKMNDEQIVLNSWLADNLKIEVGDKINVKWHVVGSHGELPEVEHSFEVTGIVNLNGPIDDLGLTPKLPGITDVDSYDEWDQPFEMDLGRLTEADERYWEGGVDPDDPTQMTKAYRATPKAFVSLNTAQKLWHSRYGNLTSYRFAPGDSAGELTKFDGQVADAFLEAYDPVSAGISFRSVKALGLQASQGTTDFSALFIAFSFFLIISAMLLIGLLFRLGIEQRISEIGLLYSIGWSDKMVKCHIVVESLVVILIGAVLGAYASIIYAEAMMTALTTRWVGAIGTSELSIALKPGSLLIGAAISIVVASGAILWSLRQLKGQSYRSMLNGIFLEETQHNIVTRTRFYAWGTGGAAVALLILTTLGIIPDAEAFAGLSVKVVMFFIVGMLGLACSLLTMSVWISRDKELAIQGVGIAALANLAVRNASRNRSRSVFTTGLISSATFVIVAVAAGQKNPTAEGPELNSGNGGFQLVAESSQPILPNLNSVSGRDEALEFINQPEMKESPKIVAILEKTNIFAFRRQPGEDASCLNPYQTTLPTVLGATKKMRERGGFTFSGVSDDHPWTLLDQELPPDEDGLAVYPVFGDLNTLQYSLHKGIGDRIPVPNAENPKAWLQIVGAFTGSIFQGVLLASEEDFLNLFPEREGYEWFLIGGPSENVQELTRADAMLLSNYLETGLNQFGFDSNRVADRLDTFLKVQNTYLKTFQTLGGLGLLLGTIGLGTVMLRNVIERGGELSLLRAVGFRNGAVTQLVLLENVFLLSWGLISGSAAALFSMSPHLLSVGANVPWLSLIYLLLGVFCAGMISALAAVIQAVRTPVLTTLRSDS
ncbi:ABC transporter permease [bacterium]|nr:ABC transporter permease [bacterium]MDB4679898.1 ABC transporter permease [Planctomycetaceae bacterium]